MMKFCASSDKIVEGICFLGKIGSTFHLTADKKPVLKVFWQLMPVGVVICRHVTCLKQEKCGIIVLAPKGAQYTFSNEVTMHTGRETRKGKGRKKYVG